VRKEFDPRRVDVAIVGGGPVGMVLALLLSKFGVHTVIFNTEPTTRLHPKGSTESARTMEIFRSLGLSDAVRTLGLPECHPTDVAYFTRFDGYELARLKMPSTADVLRDRRRAKTVDQVPEPIHRANQMHVDRLLLAAMRKSKTVADRFGWRVEGLEQDPDGVTISAASGSGDRDLWRARYVVGCDGGRSFVRRTLGIGFRGEGALEERYFGGRMFSTYIRSPALRQLMQPRLAWQCWAINPDVRSTVISVDGKDEFLLRTKAAAPNQPPDDASVRQVLDQCAGRPISIDIVGHEPWTAGAALVAERFQQGRLILAGDAVHLFTPTGGFGMNTGLEDAFNLAWKLAASVQGWAGPNLLASYEEERLPIAIRNTGAARHLSMNINEVHAPAQIEEDSSAGTACRAQASAQLATFAEQFASLGVQLGARYDGSAIIAGDEAPPPDDFIVYRPTAIPGGRAPHAWTDPSHGAGASLFDAFGAGFALLRLGPRPPGAAALLAAAAEWKIPVTVVDVPDPAVRDLYDCDLALIRPDQHVAWRGNVAPGNAEALISRLVGGN
jgi:2-polyprenyl-6-methoxyphenol hydroxylase-like FAD-dependent oxidoreductase